MVIRRAFIRLCDTAVHPTYRMPGRGVHIVHLPTDGRCVEGAVCRLERSFVAHLGYDRAGSGITQMPSLSTSRSLHSGGWLAGGLTLQSTRHTAHKRRSCRAPAVELTRLLGLRLLEVPRTRCPVLQQMLEAVAWLYLISGKTVFERRAHITPTNGWSVLGES